MQANAKVTRPHHLRIIINLQPNLPDVTFLPLRVALAEDRVEHGFLGTFPGHNHLDAGYQAIFVHQVEGFHKHHEIFVRGVARRGEKQDVTVRQKAKVSICLFLDLAF